MLIGLGAVTWAVMRRMVKKVVLQLDYIIGADGHESICITSMPVLPLLQPHTLIVDRSDCEAAIGHVLTPNFYSMPGGRWYLLPVPGWSSEDKDYLKVFLYWRYFREEQPEPPDETLIAIEGFGPYRPMQFADPDHPVAKQLGWPATEKQLAHSPFKAINGDVYAEFEVGRRLSVAERQRFTAKQQLLGQDAADSYLQKRVEATQQQEPAGERTEKAEGAPGTEADDPTRR